jgi:hypothetical protein
VGERAGNDVIAAGIGNDQVSGTAKSGGAFDVMIGGLGDDTLEGSANGFDYFYGGVGVNGGTGDGNDSYIVRGNTGIKAMNDFEVGGTADVVRLLCTGLTNFAQVQAAMSFSGVINGTVLVVDGTAQIWSLNGTQPANLTAADFLYGCGLQQERRIMRPDVALPQGLGHRPPWRRAQNRIDDRESA